MVETSMVTNAGAACQMASERTLSPRGASGPVVVKRFMPSKWRSLARVAPEVVAFSLLAALAAPGLTTLSPRLVIAAAMVIRFAWMLALFVHGSGHITGRLLVDRKTPVRVVDMFEGTTRKEFCLSLIPFERIYTPGLSKPKTMAVGDSSPIQIRLKAILGPLFNTLAAVAAFAALRWIEGNGAGGSFGIYGALSFLATNALFALTSVSDFVAFITGSTTRLACGVFVLLGRRAGTDGADLMPARFEKTLGMMGAQTQVRGRQAGGGLVLGVSPGNRVKFVGYKGVNAKRGDLSRGVLHRVNKAIARAERKGLRPWKAFMGCFHWRFGTSSAPSTLETHYHEWVPARDVEVWGFNDEGQLTRTVQALNIRIVHNGDFDGFEENPHLGVFGRKLDVGDVGNAMGRFLWPNETKGDSAKIAGVMTLLATQGMWDASARLAYLMEAAPSFKDAFREFVPSKPEGFWSTDCHGNPVERTRDASMALQVRDLTKCWGRILEAAFVRNRSVLFRRGATSLSGVNPAQIRRFVEDVGELMLSEPTLRGWTPKKKRAFAQTALYVFMNNNVETALKMFLTTARKTSTFGLSVVSTLEPDNVVLAAKGQPITIGYSPQDDIYTGASESAAVLSALGGDPDAKILDLDDEGGEIARLRLDGGLSVYSEQLHRDLSAAEVAARWMSIQKNPYIQLPREPREGEDLIKQDLDDMVGVLKTIQADFADENSWNRQTMRRLADSIIAKLRANGHKKNPAEVDFVLIAEEKSREVARRFATDLRAVLPTLKIWVVSGNRYLKSQGKLYENGILGSGTIMMAISQSGETFPTLKATRHAVRRPIMSPMKMCGSAKP